MSQKGLILKDRQQQNGLPEINMENKINIFGASGHAKSVIDVVVSAGNTIGYITDDDKTITSVLDYSVNTEVKKNKYAIVIAVGNNKTRKNIAESCKEKIAAPMVHSSAIISTSAVVGDGTVVMPNVVLNADSRVGKHCILNTGAVIEHRLHRGRLCTLYHPMYP